MENVFITGWIGTTEGREKSGTGTRFDNYEAAAEFIKGKQFREETPGDTWMIFTPIAKAVPGPLPVEVVKL